MPTFVYVASNVASAGDKQGHYMVMGYGTQSCGSFIADVNSGDAGDVRPYKSWLAGYLTSYNRWTKNTYSVMGTTDIEGAMLWLENYCKANPLQQFTDAVANLIKEVQPQKESVAP